MELGELHRTIHGRTAEREVASGDTARPKNTDLTIVKRQILRHPGLDLVRRAVETVECFLETVSYFLKLGLK